MKKLFIILSLLIPILVACSSAEQSNLSEDCYESIPEKIPGLKVQGERSEKNVIKNLWPVVCRAQELYRERLKYDPSIKGTIELKVSVEFNGEIGPYSIIRDTIEDKAFERQLLDIIGYLDFDSYGSFNSETEIILPIDFKP
jgi:hypothetical protein